MSRRALVLQHLDDDGPLRIGELLHEIGIRSDIVPLHRVGAVPPLGDYDLMLVLGATQQVWQEAEFPWLIGEKQAIREWVVERAKPYLGICFGHQLLATALGGEVGLAAEPEIGLKAVEIAAAAEGHPFLHGLTGRRQVMQWHSAEVKRLPAQAVALAGSEDSAFQAMAVDRHALSVQFHFEWTLAAVRGWVTRASWISALETALGPGAHDRLMADCTPAMPEILSTTDRLFGNFRRAAKL